MRLHPCRLQLLKHLPHALPNIELLLSAVVVDKQCGLKDPLHICRSPTAVESRAEGPPAVGDAHALFLVDALHENDVGSQATDIVDGARGFVIDKLLDGAPYSPKQVPGTHVQLPTQHEAALVVISSTEFA